jgi:hypothetical protein
LVRPGDTIMLTVTAETANSGTAVIQNLSTGAAVGKLLDSTSSLCQMNAEWIVEDLSGGDSLVPFADFGSVTFSDASATHGSHSVDPSGATLLNIMQHNTILTTVSATSDSVTVRYQPEIPLGGF